jgi:DNA-binding response OmpR family regulator
MSPREIDLLLYLARSAGQPRGQDVIYREVWGKEYGDISTVAVHIQRIRKKIEEDPAHPRWIKTAHGRGYFLDVEGNE